MQLHDGGSSFLFLASLCRALAASAAEVVSTGTPDLDAEIARRLERLKTLISELAVKPPPQAAAVSTTPPPVSPSTVASLSAAAPMPGAGLSRGSRTEQLREAEGLLGRINKPGKFNMLKYTSIGTAYGEEVSAQRARRFFSCAHSLRQPDQFAEEEIPPSKVLEFDDLDFGDEIGQGAFSWVYSGKWKDREVAIKVRESSRAWWGPWLTRAQEIVV